MVIQLRINEFTGMAQGCQAFAIPCKKEKIMRILKQTGFILSAMILVFFAACGGDGGTGRDTPGDTSVNISITQTASTHVGVPTTLTVTMRNTSDFTLSVNPLVGLDCARSGNYAVVCTPTAAGVYTVTVTAAADTSKKSSATLTVTANITGTEVKIPVVIAVSKSIAGANFEFKPTSGLTFAALEKSAAVNSAVVTPTEIKNGNTYVGFFSGNNNFTPTGGALNIGNLVFSSSGASGQSVNMTEVEIIWFTGDNVDTEVIKGSYTVQIPDTGGQGFRIGL
jgi:hypothetical protein